MTVAEAFQAKLDALNAMRNKVVPQLADLDAAIARITDLQTRLASAPAGVAALIDALWADAQR